MPHFRHYFLLTVLGGLLFAACATEQDTPNPDAAGLQIEDAWARPTAMHGEMEHADSAAHATSSTSAVYLTLRNESDTADRLLEASTEAAREVQIHQSQMEDGVMRMRRVESLEVATGESVRLEPGGYHLMLIDPTRSLQAGATFPLALRFEESGEQVVTVTVRQP